MHRILVLFFILSPLVVNAGKFPVITTMRTEVLSAGSEDYYITQELLEMGPSVDQPIGDINKYPLVALGHKHVTSASNAVASWTVADRVTATQTFSEAAVALYDSEGSAISVVSHRGDINPPPGQECVGYFFFSTNNTNWNNVYLPGGCMNVPPADEWCKLTTPELLLDHGQVTLKNVEGDVASTQFSAECTTPMSVTFKLITDQPYIFLEPTGKAEIQVDDKELGSEIKLPAGASTLTIKDILTGVSTTGVSSGSSVLVMMPY